MSYEKTNYEQDKWNVNHRRVGDAKNFVTNTRLSEICGYHSIEIPVSKRVMDIGVGDGAAIRDLAGLKNETVAVDVSSEALEKVRLNAYALYLTHRIHTIPPVDLAICHLVMQHNGEAEVLRIIEDVPLRPDGVFSFQFATLDPDRTVLPKQILEDINKGMLFFYSVDKMEEIVERTESKVVTNRVKTLWWEHASFSWNVFHVKNKV